MKRFMTSCITILVLTNIAHAKPQSPMSAREIIDRMAEVYASCRTYADEGEVFIGLGDKGTSHFRGQSFFTTFVRPSSFRFELWPPGHKEGGDIFIAWKDGELERSWWPSNPRQGETPLETTLLGFAAINQGASLTIPSALLPELFRGKSILTSLDELRLTGEEKVDGRKTSRIEGNFQGQPVKLWIDIREFLVIKIERRIKFGESELETITRYKPRVNEDISRDKLAFNPPSEGRSAKGPVPTSGPSISPPISRTALGRPASEEEPRLKNFGTSLKPNNDKADRKEKRSKVDDDDIIYVDTDLVVCDVMVLDKQGNWIEGLSKEDFVVKEDDKPQEVGSFSRGDAKTSRRSIVLIIDYSASQLPYIKTSVEAAKTLVDKLNPSDRMAIVTDDVKLLVDFTSDKELLKAKLESLKTSALSGKLGRSDQYDALMATLKELFDEEDIRPIIIFQTDGDQLDRLQERTRSNPYILIKTFSLEEMTTAAEKARATIYSIIPGIRLIGFSEEEQLKREKTDWQNRRDANAELRRQNNQPTPSGTMPPDRFLVSQAANWLRLQLALSGIANYTGGWTDFLEQPEQADGVYMRILDDMNRRYIVGYYPTNRARDGKRRRVNIEVRGHPEYVVWGRKTYFAPEP
jgi:VWFA-related protein